MVQWYLGTIGFGYKQWQGVFYPAKLATRNYLAHYSQLFDAVEIDSTFYGTPPRSHVERWAAVTPPHFKFCPKTPRAITHEGSLPDAITPMMTFLDTMQLLGDKLGVILLQFPPKFTAAQKGALQTFLQALPPSQRIALEFRHQSWQTPETAAWLARHQVCWVTADYIHLPKEIRRTTDFLYIRFLGRHGQFQTKDRELVDKTAELRQWHTEIQSHLPHVKSIYGFFNNDYAGHSPATCNRFKQIVGLEAEEIRPWQQGRLF